MAAIPFISGLKQFFGLLPAQTISGFAQEIKALTMDDKIELHAMLVKQPGFEEVQPPAVAKV